MTAPAIRLEERHRPGKRQYLCFEPECALVGRQVRVLVVEGEYGPDALPVVLCNTHGELWGGELVSPEHWGAVLGALKP